MTPKTTLYDPVGRKFSILIVARLLADFMTSGIDEMNSLDHARLCQKCIAILKRMGVDTPELPRLPQWRERPNV